MTISIGTNCMSFLLQKIKENVVAKNGHNKCGIPE